MESAYKEQSRIKSIFRAFRYRNYRLFFTGQCISLIGTWIQQIAMSWLIYHLTQSPLLLGAVGFASQIPSFLLSPFAGVWVDRLNKHRLIIITQAIFMILAMILAILTLTGLIQVWHIIVLGVVMGIANSFDMPARQAFIVEMVEDHKDLGNAIALNSSVFNLARLIGPAIAGGLIAFVGESMCFFINAISYIPVIIALSLMRIRFSSTKVDDVHIFQRLKEGVSYTFGFSPIRTILIFLAIMSFAGMPYMVLMPVFAKDVFHGSAQTLGYLMSASGVGALFGALYLASRKSVLGLGKWIVISAGLFGIGQILFSFVNTVSVALVLLSITGFGMVVHLAASNTVLQTLVDEDKRGRVMSLYTMAFMGTAPFGSLMAGALGDKVGASNTILICGIFILISNLVFALQLPSLRKDAKPVYIRKKIITDKVTNFETSERNAEAII